MASKSYDAGYDLQKRSFKPQISYADDKGENINALKDEIEQVYTSGMNKLYDKE